MEAQQAHAFRALLVARRHHAALARGDVLDRVEGEDRGAVSADRVAPVRRAECVRRILHHQHVPLAGEQAQRSEIDRGTRKMDGDDEARPFT